MSNDNIIPFGAKSENDDTKVGVKNETPRLFEIKTIDGELFEAYGYPVFSPFFFSVSETPNAIDYTVLVPQGQLAWVRASDEVVDA